MPAGCMERWRIVLVGFEVTVGIDTARRYRTHGQVRAIPCSVSNPCRTGLFNPDGGRLTVAR